MKQMKRTMVAVLLALPWSMGGAYAQSVQSPRQTSSLELSADCKGGIEPERAYRKRKISLFKEGR